MNQRKIIHRFSPNRKRGTERTRSRVLILYNEPVLLPGQPDYDSEQEILEMVHAVENNLEQVGFPVTRLGVNNDPENLFAGLKEIKPEVVFNLFEGTADHGQTEAFVAGLLEWLKIPFTGSPYNTLCVAREKPLTKNLLRGAGLPTPAYFVVEEPRYPQCQLDWPVIVKPANQDASVGLDQGSVVTDHAQLQRRIHWVLETYGPPVLVEEFIGGREINVGLIEAPHLATLPFGEIMFKENGPNFWPIVTYEAKWKPGSRDYEATPAHYPAKINPKLAGRIGDLAKRAYRLLGCRDYARVDFRLRLNGKPYILEVNPNPDFSPNAGFTGGLKCAGITHAQFTVDLVKRALARGRQTVNQPALGELVQS
jgi:D-alanine-D-alanine ligase